MPIRQLQRTDIPAVQELLRQLGYDVSPSELITRVERVLAAAEHYAAVAEQTRQLIGLVHVFERSALERPSEAVVQALVVAETSRRAGVGTALMSVAEQWARAKGLKHVVLHTRIERDDARAFYVGRGYQVAATSQLMCKDL
jgi:N-acetylglutamate synthase-like GNAT family acetyltransferase